MKKKKLLKLAIEIVSNERDRIITQGINGGVLGDAMFGEWQRDRVDKIEEVLKFLKGMRK